MGLYRTNKHKNAACSTMLLLAGLLSCSTSQAVEMYRWVDDNGRTHFSDTPPQRSRKPVTRIDSQQYELSPEQRKEAEARAANAKARAASNAARKEPEAPAPSAPGQQAGNMPAKPSPPANDCTSMRERFRDHSECLAPFMNINGSFKPNAFETCGPPVPYPAKECS